MRGTIDNQNGALENLFDKSARRVVGAISAEGAIAQARIEATTTQSLARIEHGDNANQRALRSAASDAAATAANGAGNIRDALSEQVAAFDVDERRRRHSGEWRG